MTPGFFINKTDSQCYNCSTPYCDKCSQTICFSCITNYFLSNLNFTCLFLQCQANCQTCLNQQCLSCQAGYLLQNNFCLPQTQCTNGCQVCPANYYLQNSVCLQCTGNCQYCLSLDICLLCDDGYQLDNGHCNQCVYSSCPGCSYNLACSECNQHAYISLQQFQCVSCQIPCMSCLNKRVCLNCISGYTLQGHTCISNPNFGIQIAIKTDQSTLSLIYSQLYSIFVSKIDDDALNNGGVTIKSLTFSSGLFIMTGNLSFSLHLYEPQQINQLYTQVLQYQYKIKSQFNTDVNITKWNIIVIGANITSYMNNSSPSIGLIVGLLSLVGIFLIFAIAIVISAYQVKQNVVEISSLQSKPIQMKQNILQS